MTRRERIPNGRPRRGKGLGTRARIGLILVCCAAAIAQPPQQPSPDAPIYRAGTRLVQIDVVVRDKNGPVRGLIKDNFAVFDEGRPQQIAIFRDPGVRSGDQAASAQPLSAGTVSNRLDSVGRPLENATALLLDQLNTTLDNSDYSRSWTVKFLQSLREDERIAVYVLGRRLRVIEDIMDDPAKLARALKNRDLSPGALGTRWMDNPMGGVTHDGENIDLFMERVRTRDSAAMRHQMTMEAIVIIARHLSGVPGRRNLIWLAENPQLDPATLVLLRAAGITLYPVLVRGAPDPTDHHVMGVADPHRNETPSVRDRSLQAVAASTGGVAFTDSRDVSLAAHTAEQDSASAYTLGYYPAVEMLDERFHRLRIVVTTPTARTLDLRYRSGYVASRTAVPAGDTRSTNDLLKNPLNATGIGLTAAVSVDTMHPGTHRLDLSVDLHDVRMELRGELWTGAVDLTLLDPVSGSSRTTHLRIQVSRDRFAAALEHGFPINLDGVAFPGPDVVLIVKDKASGATGSLRLALRRRL